VEYANGDGFRPVTDVTDSHANKASVSGRISGAGKVTFSDLTRGKGPKVTFVDLVRGLAAGKVTDCGLRRRPVSQEQASAQWLGAV
jgi:hypothetical protein